MTTKVLSNTPRDDGVRLYLENLFVGEIDEKNFA
jgi:hypothetical protein